jgi:hypothetical protein
MVSPFPAQTLAYRAPGAPVLAPLAHPPAPRPAALLVYNRSTAPGPFCTGRGCGCQCGQLARAVRSIILVIGAAAAPPATIASPTAPSVKTVPSQTIVVTGRV